MKNKKILVILADYEPLVTSNTINLEPYLCGLEKRGYHIDIFTRRLIEEDSYIQKLQNNRTIYRVDDKRVIRSRKWKKREQKYSDGIIRIIIKIISLIVRGFGYFIYSINSYETYAEGWDISSIRKAFQNISHQNHYDYVLSVSFPEKTQQLAKMYINEYDSNTRWLILEFDPFSYNKSNYKRCNFKKLLEIQKDNYEKSYRVLLMPPIYNYYKRTPLWEFEKKLYKLEYATLKPVEIKPELVDTSVEINKSTISLLFCGTLKSDVRPPDRLFDILKNIDGVTLYLMTGANMREWNNYLVDLGNHVVLMGRKNIDTAYSCMSRADILINIGNTVEYQVPAKLYEYMSFGKPIVHIANSEKDGCKEHVKRYPLGLYVDFDLDCKEAGRIMKEFIVSKRNKRINYDEIIEHMPELLPETIISNLADMLDQ